MPNLKYLHRFSLIAATLLIAEPTIGAEEGVSTDKEGNYVVGYWGDDQDNNRIWRQILLIPGNKVVPVVESKIRMSDSNSVNYRYRVRVRENSGQALVRLTLPTAHIMTDLTQKMGWDVSKMGWDANLSASDIERLDLKSLNGALATPSGWRGAAIPNIGGVGLRVSWTYSRLETNQGLLPGSSLNGFGFSSMELPGVGVMRFAGAKPAFQGYPDNGPEQPLYDQVMKLVSPDSDSQSVPRPAAIPKIPNPTPFNAVTVLSGLQQHVKEDLVGMKLVEPGFALKLDQGLVAAIEAGKRGNTEGLRSELKKLRQLLKGLGEPEEEEHTAMRDRDEDNESWPPEDQINTKAWPHPIAKLAARVLEFDLRYVEKRVKGVLE